MSFSLAPKNPNWDLKRDIAKQLEFLEHQTQKAIIELIREYTFCTVETRHRPMLGEKLQAEKAAEGAADEQGDLVGAVNAQADFEAEHEMRENDNDED
jgi:hypothetical protein